VKLNPDSLIEYNPLLAGCDMMAVWQVDSSFSAMCVFETSCNVNVYRLYAVYFFSRRINEILSLLTFRTMVANCVMVMWQHSPRDILKHFLLPYCRLFACMFDMTGDVQNQPSVWHKDCSYSAAICRCAFKRLTVIILMVYIVYENNV